jgi:Asp-tRNA(Asn)/Glu-tRNA(Gln) amidotransferase A subunit family amidase
MVPVALGTQTAGSVLRPAAFCGVVGFKPTYGLVPTAGVFPFAPSLDTVGWFAASVLDAQLLLAPLAGMAVAAAPTSTPPLTELGLQVARVEVGRLLTPEIAQHEGEVVDRLRGAGVEVLPARLPFGLETLWAAQSLITHAEGAAVHTGLIGEKPAAYGPALRAMVELGHAVPGWSYAQALATQRLFGELVDEYLERFDLLILPTVGEVAPERSTTGRHQLQSIATFLGLPAIALPTGRDAAGLPLSTQLVGRRGRDAQLLDQASRIEAALGIGRRPAREEIRHA